MGWSGGQPLLLDVYERARKFIAADKRHLLLAYMIERFEENDMDDWSEIFEEYPKEFRAAMKKLGRLEEVEEYEADMEEG